MVLYGTSFGLPSTPQNILTPKPATHPHYIPAQRTSVANQRSEPAHPSENRPPQEKKQVRKVYSKKKFQKNGGTGCVLSLSPFQQYQLVKFISLQGCCSLSLSRGAWSFLLISNYYQRSLSFKRTSKKTLLFQTYL